MSLASRQVWNWRTDTPEARRLAQIAHLRRLALWQGFAVLALGTVLNKGLGHETPGRILVVIGAVQLVVALWRPHWLVRPFRFFQDFGRLVGRGLAWLLLTPLWLLVFVPGNWWLRLRGRDPLHRAALAPGLTAWIARRHDTDPADARRQFLVEDPAARAAERPVNPGAVDDAGGGPRS